MENSETRIPRHIEGHFCGLPIHITAWVPENGPGEYGCTECGDIFPNESLLVAHVVQKHRGLQE